MFVRYCIQAQDIWRWSKQLTWFLTLIEPRDREVRPHIPRDIEGVDPISDDPIPRPLAIESIVCDTSKPYGHMSDSCFPIEGQVSPKLSLSDIFGKHIHGVCGVDVARENPPATLCLDLSDERNITATTSGYYKERKAGSTSSCYVLTSGYQYLLEKVARLTFLWQLPISISKCKKVQPRR